MSKKLLSLVLVLAMLVSIAAPALAVNETLASDTIIYSSSTKRPDSNYYVSSITLSGADVLKVDGIDGTSPMVWLNASTTADDATLSTTVSAVKGSNVYSFEQSGAGEFQLVNGEATQTITCTSKFVRSTTTVWTFTFKKANAFTVTLPENPVGYTVTPLSGSTSIMVEGQSYYFKVDVNGDTHEKGPDFKVLANGTELTADSDGVYTIPSIAADQTIEVQGVTERAPYFVYTFGGAEANAGDEIAIPVSLKTNLAGSSVWQSIHLISYNPSDLQFISAEGAGCFAGLEVSSDAEGYEGYIEVTINPNLQDPVTFSDGQIMILHFRVLGNGTGSLDNNPVGATYISSADVDTWQRLYGRNPYIMLADNDEKEITDLTVATRGEVRLYMPTVLAAPVLTTAAASGTSITVAAPAASAEDSKAAIQYRMSADGETWDDNGWQSSNVFSIPAYGASYWFQARYVPSNTTYYRTSPASEAISVETVAVSGIALDRTELTLDVNAAAQLTATVSPENATNPAVTWTSGDAAVAKVENGLVTAVGAGSTTITAQAGDEAATCSVTVQAGEPVEAEDTVIYDDTAAKNKKPYSSAYITQVILSGVKVEDFTCTASGNNFNVEVTLDYTTRVGSSWTLSYTTAGTAAMVRRLYHTVGPITWNEDGTATQSYKASYNNTASRTSIWNIHYVRALSPAAKNVINLINAIGDVDRSSGPAITAAREAYDALSAEDKARIENYDTLLAAEALFAALGDNYTVLDAPVLDGSAAAVGCTVITLAAPAASEQDPDAVVEYRISEDNVNWSEWQREPAFKALRSQTDYWFQARYFTSDKLRFEHSEPSETVQLRTADPIVKEVSTYAEFVDAFTTAPADGTETLIKLMANIHMTQDEKGQPHMPAGSVVTIEGVNGGLYLSHGAGNYGYFIDAGATLTLRNLTCGMTREYDLYWIPANCWCHLFRADGNGVTVNVDNVKFYNNMGGSAAALVNASPNVEMTVNVYSLIANPFFSKYAITMSSGGTNTLNLMPKGDIALYGQVINATTVNVIPQPGYTIKSAASKNASGWTAADEATVTELNAGTAIRLEGLEGYVLNVTDAPAIPAALTAPVVAEEGTPEAETADMVYSVGNTTLTVTIKNWQSPQAASFPMIKGAQKLDNGSMSDFWRCYSDKSDGLKGLGNVYTFTGLKEDTDYTYTFGWFSLASGWGDATTDVTIHTKYTVNQLAAPVLSEQVEKTGSSVELTPVAASTQDATATAEYRMSADGETWGEWQSGTLFEGLTGGTAYYFQARYVAADYHWSDSEPSEALQVTTKATTLQAPVLDASAAAADVSSVTLTAPATSAEDAAATLQYRMSEDGELWGEWQNEPVFADLKPKTTYYFQAHYVPSSPEWLTSEPSEAITVTTEKDPNAAAFVVGSVTGAAGTEVKVEISMKNNPGIVAANLELNYDQEKLELVGVENAGLLPNYTGSNSPAVYPFVLYWEASTAEANLTDNGLLATATFRIKDTAAEGDSARVWITYDPDNVYDYDMSNVSFETEEGAVTVGPAPTGFAVTVLDRTAHATTTLSAGDYSGELTFSVTNDQACAVMTKDEENNYMVLTATGEGDTYSFTVTVDKPLTVIIAVKGDVDGSGTLSVSDIGLVNRSLLSAGARAYLALSDEQALIADVDGDGSVSVSDAGRMGRALVSESARAYLPLAW